MDTVNRGESRFSFDSVDLWLILPAAVIALLAILLFVPFALGINVPLFLLALYCVVFTYQGRAHSESDRGSIYLLLIVLIVVLPFLLYDTSPFRILQFILLFFCALFQIFTMYGCRYYKRLFSENWLFDAVNAVLFMPFANLPALMHALRALSGGRKALTTAALGLFGLLFAPALTIWLTHAYTGGFGVWIAAYCGGAAFFFLFTGYLYAFLCGCRYGRNTCLLKKPTSSALRRVPAWISLVLLLALSTVCTIYLAQSYSYLLPALTGRLPDADLAAFARQGFLELCAMVLLNLGSIGFAAVFTRAPKRENAVRRWMRSSSPAVLVMIIVLSMLSILLVVTALIKMVLYMRSYGLTTNRMITSWFMLGLIVVCIIILARAFSPRVHLIRSVSIAAVTMFLILCYADCDYLALSYNRNAYVSGRLPGFDIEMLYTSGDSIVPVMIDVYENSSGQVRTDAQAFLEHYIARYEDTLGKVRSFNIASYVAHNKYVEWKQGAQTP